MTGRFATAPALVPLKYENFPLGAIKPKGWMRDQLHLSAKGLGGNLFHFYRFVKDSTWLGGTWEYTPLNEAAPYWYNYIVPLAYSFDESSDHELFYEMKRQADHFLDYTISHQAADGWLGPEKTSQTRGLWARCLLLQGLINHAIADDSKRQSILDAVYRFVRLAHRMLRNNFEGYIPREGDVFDLQLFGVARAHELSLTLQWLYDNTADSEDQKIIWDVMEMMWEGSRIAERDWTVFFAEENFPRDPSVRYKSLNFKHGVNVAQGLRYPAHLYRMHPTEELARLSQEAVTRVFRYHGTPAGSISSDEYIGGLSPQRGSELCCSVELMFSLTYLYQLFGDNSFADRVELAAYNAIPAGISADWWSHQYITQTNQPWACEFALNEVEKTPFYDVCRYANVFGLEPEFPCCTVNFSTAYPKLLMNAFLKVRMADEAPPAIVHAYLIPSTFRGDGIVIDCATNYPFPPWSSCYEISTQRKFDFFIRIPSWASSSSTISLYHAGSEAQGKTEPLVSNVDEKLGIQGLYKITIPSAGEYKVNVALESGIRVERQQGNSVSIYYGPLLYAYEVEFETTTRLPRNYKDQASNCAEIAQMQGQSGAPWISNVRDHDYLPKNNWNIAIDMSQEMKVVTTRPLAELPSPVWTSKGSPVCIEATAVEVEWPVKNGTAGDPGEVPTVDAANRGTGFKVHLVPYGSAKLHIAQFPVINS